MSSSVCTAQRAANRANAQHSTGPRTEAGKQRASLNAVRHGLTGQILLLPAGELDQYQAYTTRLIDSYEPVGPQEQDLAQTIADESWRLHHIRILENNMFACAVFEQSGTIVEQALSPANPDLSEAVHSAIAQVRGFEEKHRSFATLSLYKQRTTSAIEKAKKELKQLKAERPDPVPGPRPTAPGEERPIPIPPPVFPDKVPAPDPAEAPVPDPEPPAARSETPRNGFVFSSAPTGPETAPPQTPASGSRRLTTGQTSLAPPSGSAGSTIK